MALFGSKEQKNAKKVEEAWALLDAGKPDKAVSKITMAAIGGYAPAEYLMAVAARKLGNTKDALFWRKSAAEKGVADARKLLEQLQGGNAGSTDRKTLLDAYYDNKDWANAAKLAAEMVAEGDSYAANLLASMYYRGNGVQQDYAKALELFEKSARQGYVSALSNIGWFYGNAEGYKDPVKAVEYNIQAAEKGHPSAMYRLGKAYEDGSGVEQDMDKAVLWYYKGDKRGNSLAAKRLKEIRDDICHNSIERKEFDWVLQQLVENDKAEREEKRRLEQQKKEQTEEAARRQAEEKARIEAEQKAKAQAEAAEKARLAAEQKAKVEAEEKARAEAEMKARIEEEEKARLKAELKARIEAQVRAEMEAEIKAKVEAEMQAKAAAEEKARMEAARKAKADAQRYGEEMINKARNLCAGGDFENGEKVVRELLAVQPDNRSAQHLLSEIEDVKAYAAQQAAEKAAKEEAERKAREEAERRAKAEAEEKARLAAERKAKAEAEEKARLEAEQKAKARAEAAEKANLAPQQAETDKNTDEIFTPERLRLMEQIAVKYAEEHKKRYPYYRSPADEELDWAEEAYRKGDYEKAYNLRKYYEDSSARGINMLGAMQLTGRGTKKDGAAALKNFERAASVNYPPACYNLGMMYLLMENDGNRALNIFEKGADEGNIKCMLRRSEVYLKGLGGVEKEPVDGCFWLETAAKSGDMEAAKQVVELLYTHPEYTDHLYFYLKMLAEAGDNEICARVAHILSTGAEGKMEPKPASADYFFKLLKRNEQANTDAAESEADKAEKDDIIKRAKQIYNMSADQLAALRKQMLEKGMDDEADQLTEFVLDNKWLEIWCDIAVTGSVKGACEEWEKYKDAVDRSTYSQQYYRLDAASHFALLAKTLNMLETDEDDDTVWVIGGTVISGAFVPDMLMELANANGTVMVLDPFDNFQMARMNEKGLLQITEEAMVGDERYFIIRTKDGQRPQIDPDSLITYFHEYDMSEELYCPVLDYSYDISQVKLKDMIFVHYFEYLYDTVKTPAEKEQVMRWLDRKYLDTARMHIRNGNTASAAYIVNAVLDYFPEYDAALQLKEELSNR